jgi:hypothetical protein
VNLGSTVNSSAFEVSISISTDGLSFIFDSDRSGGYGGHDLWVSTRPTLSEPWSTPVNLGSMVNSSKWDYAPALSADSLSLFFTSGRSGGYGADDIWLTSRETKDDPWGEPVNLGPEVNSSSGEGNPGISADGSTLYFNSNRPGGLARISHSVGPAFLTALDFELFFRGTRWLSSCHLFSCRFFSVGGFETARNSLLAMYFRSFGYVQPSIGAYR